ncbi:hypothetical protein HBI49_088910 [Parastagonospora nodorum]|nr:hypothetical protein HBI50_140030 [Parastagonospora nodorum]KAH5359120.1 hypothetical protein HBI48_110360 [Parastagonospora nodorum]KAH5368414.1 hypothetical protein HBI49_088910 [Parastagonospora nodorum]KAH5499033.1 hypothetical protein HBI31_087060 [Parastagonospora nodorum]KAH6042762.1 hypothetical protein HBI54_128040 [Parastagonospora nodorum]
MPTGQQQRLLVLIRLDTNIYITTTKLRKALPSGHAHAHARAVQANPMGSDMHSGHQSSHHGGHQSSRHDTRQSSRRGGQQSSRHDGHQCSRHGGPSSYAGQSSRHGNSSAQTGHIYQFNGPPGPSARHSQTVQFSPAQFMQHPKPYTAPQPVTGPMPGPRELFIHPDFPGRVLCGHRIEVIPDDVYAPAYEEMFEGNQRMKIHQDAGTRKIPRPPHLMKQRPRGNVRYLNSR